MPETPQAAGPLPFGATVTILFSDIRGFTEFTSQYGDEAAFEVLRTHNTTVRSQLDLYGGNVVKTQGDSFMVSFTTARGAILCAVAIQRAIAAADAHRGGTRIAVGIGINTGEPIQEGGDFFGSTVNLAARLCAAAGPGQIIVSETTRYVAGRVEGFGYVDRGLHDLKGFLEPQRLYEVRWAADGADEAAAEAGDEVGGEAIEGAVQRAIGVLTRVLGITHREDAAFRPLLECQAKASDLRLQLSRALSERRGYTVRKVDEAMLPFADLLMLVESREPLDDQRWSQIEASVGRVFGRELAVAATRGKLGVDAPARRAEPGAAAPAPAPPPPPARTSAPTTLTPTAPPVALDPRAEAVPWWAAAHRAWTEWKSSGMAWAHALRAALARHPHLLAVPITESAAHDGGRLASGYFLLLEHVENQSPAFMRTAVERAAEGAGSDPGALGAALYELMLKRGRLGETYPDFVRDVMVATIPNPGVWVDGGVTESDEATVVKRRPRTEPGNDSETTERLTETAARAAEHRFVVALPPLTARFFFVKGEVKQPHDVELRVREGAAPSDRACYLTLRTGHLLHTEPRRIKADGVLLSGLGRDFAGVWVALFNADGHGAMEAELGVTVRAPGSPLSRRSPFSALGRKPR